MKYTSAGMGGEAQGVFRDNQKVAWAYITPQEYRQLPREQRRICADLRGRDSESLDRVLEGEEGSIGLYEYQPRLKWNETVVGYIPVCQEQEETPSCCVRIVAPAYGKMVLYPLFAVLLVACVVVGALWWMQKEPVPGLDQTAVAYHIDGVSNTDPSQIMMPLVPEMQIAQGETHITELLINPEGNQCYFKFMFLLDDTGEVIYESGLVEPGKAIIDFDLNRTLEVGEYKVTVKILTSDLNDTTKSLNGGDIKTLIRVVK